MFGFPKFPSQTIDDDLGSGGNNQIGDDFGDPGGGLPGGGGTPADTTRPTVAIKTVSPSSLSIAYNGSASTTVTVTAYDFGTGMASVTLDGTTMSVSGATYTRTKTYSYNSGFAGTTRTNYLTVIGTDNAGNSTSVSQAINVTYEKCKYNKIQ